MKKERRLSLLLVLLIGLIPTLSPCLAGEESSRATIEGQGKDLRILFLGSSSTYMHNMPNQLGR